MSIDSSIAAVPPLAEPSAQRAMSIGIMGTPLTSGNRGVLALGAALARLCLDASPGSEILVFGSHPRAEKVRMRPTGEEIAISVIHWRMSPRSHPRDHLLVILGFSLLYRLLPLRSFRRWAGATIPWIGALQKTDLVGDVRGGDSFSDIYGLKRFVIATLPILSVIWVKGGIVQFPQTYGPFKSRTARRIARWVLQHSSTVIARDTTSQAIAQELVGSKKRVLLSPDVAFALHVDPMDRAELDGVLSALPANLIGLNVNGLMFNGGYTGKNMFGLSLDYRPFVTDLARALLAAHPGPLLLVPHTYAPAGDVESDNDACRVLKESLPPELQARVKIVTGEYDAHQLKGIIGRCQFFVGSRMHSCIAALSQGIPCVGVAYSMKFAGVFESVGKGDWVVDARSTATPVAVENTVRLYQQNAAATPGFGRPAEQARQKLAAIFRDLLNRHAA